jgi:hypothetical protein
MKLSKAREIVNLYGGALSKLKDGEISRKVSLLPTDKETIIKATKLFVAYLIEFESLDKQAEDALIVSLSGIGTFVPDDRAMKINEAVKLIRSGVTEHEEEKKIFGEFITEMDGTNIIQDVEEFINSVYALNREDPLFHQRVYTLAGIEYSPSKKKSFWSSIFG